MGDAVERGAGRMALGRLLVVPPRPFVGALWIAVAGPALVALAAKLHRVAIHSKGPSSGEWVALLLPNLIYQFGLAAIALSLFSVCGSRRRLGLALAQGLGLISVCVTALAHGYYVSTGQVLDYELFAFALSRADEVFSIVTAEVPVWMNLAAVAVPALLLATPWWWLRHHRAPAPAYSAPAGKAAIAATTSCLLGLGVACLYLAKLPDVDGYRRGFVRPPLLHLSVGASRRVGGDQPRVGYADVPRAMGATALRHRGGERPNVVVVVLESTRASATTPYRPNLASTPFLAELAADSLLVERAYAVVPHTSKALVAVLCGLEPRATVEVVEATEGGLPGTCLAGLLSEEGYRTAFFQAPTAKFEDRAKLVRNMGFGEFHSGDRMRHRGLSRVNYFGYEDDIMLPASKRFVAARKTDGEPFFAAYLTNVGHSPYGVPEDFEVQPLSSSKLRNSYFNAILYSDGFLRRLFAQYEKAGLLDKTIFVVVGDHGEGTKEHGARGHDTILYDEGVTVPLLMRLPGGKDARRVPGPFSQLSIAPSIVDAAGFDVTDGAYEGASFLRTQSEPVVYVRCYRSRTCAAMVKGDLKLIYYYDDRDSELFDLRADRKERRDLARRRPEVVREWTTQLLDWTAAVKLAHDGSDVAALSAYVSESPPATIQRPLRVRFAPFFEFLGFDPPRGKLRRGTHNRTRFYFQALGPIPRSYRLRIRVQAPGGESTELLGGVPVRGLYPLERWRAGQYITDVRSYKLRNWDRRRASYCIELRDAQGALVTGTGPDGPIKGCHPIGTLRVRGQKGSKRP